MDDSRGLEIYAGVMGEIEKEFPDFDIVSKTTSKLMRSLDTALRIISLNQMNTFMTAFVTTVGETVYVPRGWTERNYLLRAITLRHERVHMRQKRRLGMFLFTFLYLFWIFPIGLALSRRIFEQEAYAESLRASVEYFGPGALGDSVYREHIIRHFLGPGYLWTWPYRRSIEAWYDDLAMTIRRELAEK